MLSVQHLGCREQHALAAVGKPLEDLKLGLAAAAKLDGQIDTGNACALGASYGGYMMNWIAGNWPDGFKCLVNHAGIFDLRSFAFSTEELWFDQWDHGGTWWDRPDAEKWNPINHIDKWKTPTLFIHGEKDFRIPYVHSIMPFTYAQEKGIPSKLLIFPDENHWVLKPQNSIQSFRSLTPLVVACRIFKLIQRQLQTSATHYGFDDPLVERNQRSQQCITDEFDGDDQKDY